MLPSTGPPLLEGTGRQMRSPWWRSRVRTSCGKSDGPESPGALGSLC